MSTYRNKNHINCALIGHSGHGKTTMARCIKTLQSQKGLASAWQDRSKQEPNSRTVASYATEFETEKKHYALIDCPGHKDYVKNMCRGVSNADVGILIVSATDKIMEQTREHIYVARSYNVNNIIVVISKVEDVDSELLDLLELEIRELLTKIEYDGDNIHFIRFSAVKALEGDSQNIEAYQSLLDKLDSFEVERDTSKPFQFSIVQAYANKGDGTVVTGTVKLGTVKPGDELEIIGIKPTQKTKCISIQTFNKPLEHAEAGDFVGILLEGIQIKQIKKGQIVAKPGAFSCRTDIWIEAYILKKDEGGRCSNFREKYSPVFYIGNACVTGKVTDTSGCERIEPGDNLKALIKLMFPIFVAEGKRIVMRDADRTIGVGVISKVVT